MVYFFFRGGKYSEDDAKAVMVQILNVVAFCHLQGVVHRDLKPEVSISFSFIIFTNTSISFAREGNCKPSMDGLITPSFKKNHPLIMCHMDMLM